MKSILPVQALGKKEGNLKISCFNEAQFVKRVCNFSYRQNSKCTLFELAIINFFNVGISDSYGDEVIAEEISWLNPTIKIKYNLDKITTLTIER